MPVQQSIFQKYIIPAMIGIAAAGATGAFKLAWDTIQSGHEFFAYVKNMAKDGSYYWVFTHIAPDFSSNGSIVGFTSVRRCPKRSALEKIIPVYQQMFAVNR